MNLRHWLTGLYPRSWRMRYGEEFDALLEECLRSPLDVLDILLGALDAHLDFPHEMDWRWMNMLNKLRTSILIVFAAYIGFIVAGLALYGMVDDSPMAALMKTDTPLSTAWITVEAGAALALLAVIIGGLPLAWTVIRRAFHSSRRDLLYLLVPVFAFLALVSYAGFMALVAFGVLHIPGVLPAVSADQFPLGNRLLIGAGMLVFVLGALASTAAVWKVLLGTDVETSTLSFPGRQAPMQLYKFAFIPAGITALALLVMLLATLVWGWLVHSARPEVFAQSWGLLLTNTSAWYAVILMLMSLSTAAAFFGLARGYSAWKRA